MAVYTRVSQNALSRFLAPYELGGVLAFTGIVQGIENSNFYLTTTRGRHILTVFEQMPGHRLPYYLDLMAFASARGIPCTRPLLGHGNNPLGELCGKPAAVFTRLPGASVICPTPNACAQLGATLARLHVATADFGLHQADSRGDAWRQQTAAAVQRHLTAEDAQLALQSVAWMTTAPLAALPTGTLHADLFRDNVLFDDTQLTGIVDFYCACRGPWLYDLAIAVIDWCVMDRPAPDLQAAQRLIRAYRAIRPLQAEECVAWPAAWRAAGLRFWLSRLQDACYPRAGELTFTKDPNAFRQIIHLALDQPTLLRAMLA